MLKEFVEKLVSLKDNKLYEIHGETYSDNSLIRIEKHIDRPRELCVYSLDSLVELIKSESHLVGKKVYVQIEAYNKVNVFTTYDDTFKRDFLYNAVYDGPKVDFGWKSHEETMIKLRSNYVHNEGIDYLLNILSRITDENSITSRDNGITQEVEARRGVSLASKEVIKPKVSLIPYRTFLEAKQPESEFLVRLREGGQIGLFEADGGMWQLTAKQNIKEYFDSHLKDLIENDTVVVMC